MFPLCILLVCFWKAFPGLPTVCSLLSRVYYFFFWCIHLFMLEHNVTTFYQQYPKATFLFVLFFAWITRQKTCICYTTFFFSNLQNFLQFFLFIFHFPFFFTFIVAPRNPREEKVSFFIFQFLRMFNLLFIISFTFLQGINIAIVCFHKEGRRKKNYIWSLLFICWMFVYVSIFKATKRQKYIISFQSCKSCKAESFPNISWKRLVIGNWLIYLPLTL